jgi:glutamyl-tRNA synthetase
MTREYRGRLAPSPTGGLHLGNVRTALCAWLRARAAGGKLVLRMEDIDTPRVVPGAARAIIEDLRWLGLDWDEGPDVGGPHAPYVQSARMASYAQSLHELSASDLVFPCTCSRKEIAAVASAPHGDLGPVYPGTCRPDASRDQQGARLRAHEQRSPALRAQDHGSPALHVSDPLDPVPRLSEQRSPALRFKMAVGEAFDDVLHGRFAQPVTDDFVLRRGDGVYAYQLAVVVDDSAMQISEVVRGDDLLSSTPRQLALYRALGAEPPAFLHVPLLLRLDGERLSKRNGAPSIAEYRAAGITPQRILGLMAHSLGLADQVEPLSAQALIPRFDLARLPRAATRLDASIAALSAS